MLDFLYTYVVRTFAVVAQCAIVTLAFWRHWRKRSQLQKSPGCWRRLIWSDPAVHPMQCALAFPKISIFHSFNTFKYENNILTVTYSENGSSPPDIILFSSSFISDCLHWLIVLHCPGLMMEVAKSATVTEAREAKKKQEQVLRSSL